MTVFPSSDVVYLLPIMVCKTLAGVRAYVNLGSSASCGGRVLTNVANVERIVEIERNHLGGRYVVELSGIGWVGGGDITPAVPRGTVIHPESGDPPHQLKQNLFASPDDNSTNDEPDAPLLRDYTLLRVMEILPGQVSCLRVQVLSGEWAGKSGYVDGIGYYTQSGYDIEFFAAALPSN